MARPAATVAFLAATTVLALAPVQRELAAQRPALTGEKARVAEAVRRDLSKLSELQRTHHQRTRLYAADIRDLNFSGTSGAEVSIAFASANAWAANASHTTLSPVKCFVIVSAADAADAPTAQPFCTDAEPGTAAARVASSTAPTTTPANPTTTPTKSAPGAAPAATKQPQRQASNPTTPRNTGAAATSPARSTPPSQGTTGTAPARSSGVNPGIRMMTRDASSDVTLAERIEPVTSAQFTDALTQMAREAVRVMDSPPPEVVRDPYESSAEFEARRAEAFAAYQRREQEYFRSTKRSFTITLPVRGVRYDADAEILMFNVDPIRLPTAREGRSQLTVACFTRPAFWCMPDSGLTYDASDLWKVQRAAARRFDVLRSPLTLTMRFTVGGRPDGGRELAVSLVDMELQARGESVQRWPAR
jgi:hypothetical protein